MGIWRRRSRRKRRALSYLLVLVLAALIVGYRFVDQIGHEKKPADRFLVKRALDGDTVELGGGDRLRLLAVDTPEKGEKYSDAARKFVDSLAVGKTARIEYDRTRRDKYGRLLGFLYVDDTLLVNKAILANGLGYLYLFENSELQRDDVKQMLNAQRDAMACHAGIWSIERDQEPYYVAPARSFRLHRPGCESVENLKPGQFRTFKTREEGLSEGLSPCRNCKP